jgi:hypothetical protein
MSWHPSPISAAAAAEDGRLPFSAPPPEDDPDRPGLKHSRQFADTFDA